MTVNTPKRESSLCERGVFVDTASSSQTAAGVVVKPMGGKKNYQPRLHRRLVIERIGYNYIRRSLVTEKTSDYIR